MVYFSSDAQFVRVSAIEKKEKATLWWLVHKDANDLSDSKSPSVTVPGVF